MTVGRLVFCNRVASVAVKSWSKDHMVGPEWPKYWVTATPLFKKFDSKPLDGHPTPATPLVRLSTGASGVGVAGSFGLHERTLHRRLRESGTNYRRELDEVRRALSEQLLGNTGLTVSDIATTLGYADASGFIRAFERWCGISPNAWRKGNAES